MSTGRRDRLQTETSRAPQMEVKMSERATDGHQPVDIAFARWFAVQTSRRRFLGTMMKGAFAVGAAGSMWGSILAEPASANHVCSDPGESPYCDGGCCDSIALNCKNTSGCKGRPYQGSTCQTSGGCWTEYEWGRLWKCCDCCTTSSVGGGSCTGCGAGTWQKCICEFDTGITAPEQRQTTNAR